MARRDGARPVAAGLAPVLGELLDALRGRPEPLVPFDEVRRQLALTHMVDRGIFEVPTASITGSLGRTRDFDRAFLPRGDLRRRRLDQMRGVAEQSGFPPIELYQVGDAYFVVDGHHRVALAREMDLGAIEAHVWEFPTDVDVAPGDDVDQVVAKAARRNFQRATGLDDAEVDVYLWLSDRLHYLRERLNDASLRPERAAPPRRPWWRRWWAGQR